MASYISVEPAFNWWFKQTLQHIYSIIYKVVSKSWRTLHKFGIRVPKIVKEAYEIYRKSGNDFWTKAIAKDMTNVSIAFDNIDRVTPDEMGKGEIKTRYEHVNVHMIFDVNTDGNFTRKARLVACVHTPATPSSITYSSAVSR